MPLPVGRIVLLAGLLALAGCAEPPWTLRASPSGIALRWYPDKTPSAAAEQVAELHCRSVGRTAELASSQRDGSAQIARYSCR